MRPLGDYVAIARQISEICGIAILFSACCMVVALEVSPVFIKQALAHQLIPPFNTAIGFVFIGIAMACLQASRMDKALFRLTARLCACALIGIALILGSFSFNTAIYFLLIGLALFLSSRLKTRLIYGIHFLAILVLVFSLIAVISLLYGAAPLAIGPYFNTAMTLTTAVLFIITSIGILFLRPDKGLMAATTHDLLGAKMMRVLLPVAIVMPIGMGYLKLYAQKTLHLSNAFSLMLLVMGDMGIITVYIYVFSVFLNRSDNKRKGMEEDTRNAHELLQRIIDLLPIRIFWKDKDLRFLGCNQVFAKDVGKDSPLDLIGKDCLSVYDGVQADRDRIQDETIMASGIAQLNVEESQTDPRKGPMWFKKTKVPLTNVQGDLIGILGNYEDITQRKKEERRQIFFGEILSVLNNPLELKDTLQEVVRAIKQEIGVDAVDIRLKKDGDSLVSQNADVACACGLVISGKIDARVPMHTQGGSFWTNQVRQLLSSDKSSSVHLSDCCVATGCEALALIPIRAHQEIIGLIALNSCQKDFFTIAMVEFFERIGVNIGIAIKRKHVEYALQYDERKLSAIMASSQDAIMMMNPQGCISFWNQSAERILGYQSQEVMGKNLHHLLTPSAFVATYEAAYPDFQKTGKGNVIGKMQELVAVRKDGVKIVVELSVSSISREDGWHAVGFLRDITEQKKIEAEVMEYKDHLEKIVEERTKLLQEAKEVAEQSLAVRDEFTSTVSHELRTPLAAIKSSIDILDTQVPGALTEDQKTFIKRVKLNIDRLARLINDVLDLSKLEAGKMVMNFMPLRVESVIQEVIDSQENLVKAKGLTIKAEFGEDLPVLNADKDRLVQVFNNLINNALKFTTQGGIVIAVYAEDKESITCSVRDTGIGIKDEDLSKLFKKFQQVGGLSQQVAGTGLGLAICKLIVTKHKGRIWVESQYGQGSCFNFNLPIRKNKRILIVDDDEGTLEVLRKVLEDEKIYEIEMASDGFKAGQKYYDFSPHLIILDINLPKINGLEVCLKIKNDPKTQHTKIIMISSFQSEEKKKEAWDTGADELINKPINPEELMAKVRKLI